MTANRAHRDWKNSAFKSKQEIGDLDAVIAHDQRKDICILLLKQSTRFCKKCEYNTRIICAIQVKMEIYDEYLHMYWLSFKKIYIYIFYF